MPNIKSEKKRVKVNATKELQNQMVKNAMRTELKNFDAVVADGDEQARKAALARVTKCVDKAAAKGILHKNTAARTKSRLAKKAAV